MNETIKELRTYMDEIYTDITVPRGTMRRIDLVVSKVVQALLASGCLSEILEINHRVPSGLSLHNRTNSLSAEPTLSRYCGGSKVVNLKYRFCDSAGIRYKLKIDKEI